jgi:porphobilinogen deaminase
MMKYPSIEDLRERARQKIPRFAFEYLDGGCNEEVNLHKNTAEIREIELEAVLPDRSYRLQHEDGIVRTCVRCAFRDCSHRFAGTDVARCA